MSDQPGTQPTAREAYAALFRQVADRSAEELQGWGEALAQIASQTPQALAERLEKGDAMIVAAVRSEVYEHFVKGFATAATPVQLVAEADRMLAEAAMALASRSGSALTDFLREQRVAVLAEVLDRLRALSSAP